MKDSLQEMDIHTPKKSNLNIDSQIYNNKNKNINIYNNVNLNDNSMTDLDKEIQSVLENETDKSISNDSIDSNEDSKDDTLIHLTDPKFWQYDKDKLFDNESPKSSNWTKEDKDSAYKTEPTKSSNKQSIKSNEEDYISNYEGNNSINKNIFNNGENEILNKEQNIESNNNYKNIKLVNNTDNHYHNVGNSYINSGIQYFQSSFPFQPIYRILPNYNCIYNKLQEQQNLYQQINKINSMNNINQNTSNNINPIVNNNIQNNNTSYPKVNLNMVFNPKVQQQVQNESNNNNTQQTKKTEKDNKSFSDDKSEKNNKKENISNDNKKQVLNSEKKNKNNKTKNETKNVAPPKTTNSSNNNKNNSKGEKQVLNLDDIALGKDTRATIMIRNIPIKYTEDILSEDLEEFKGKYDCLYLPFDYDKNGNKGYAFINFVNPLHILYFYEKFNGKKWSYFESPKICELNSAHFQGINEIQKHAKNYKGQKKPSFFSKNDENIIIPNKYLSKLLERFPKMKYTENKAKKIFTVKSFE